jgi:hypothetical protein
VRRLLAERQLMLAAVAVLAAAVALAVTTRHQAHARQAALPATEGSYSALAGAAGPKSLGRTTSCGVVVGPRTMGVSSPVLPCGVRLYLAFRTRHVLVSVIGGAAGTGREFDLTAPLARKLGVEGVRRIRWGYAAAA